MNACQSDYTDEMQLPIYDAIKNLPRLDAVPGFTQIRAQNLGGNGQTVSHPGAKSRESNPTESLVNRGICHVLSQPVASCQIERVKGIMPGFFGSSGVIFSPLVINGLGGAPVGQKKIS
jgi:hypothetical protein